MAQVRLYQGGSWLPTPLFLWRDLHEGQTLDGPAIIVDEGATTVVDPGWRAQMGERGDLLLRRVQRQMDLFEETFWSGNSLEDLYAALVNRETTATASLFVAAMREWKNVFR